MSHLTIVCLFYHVLPGWWHHTSHSFRYKNKNKQQTIRPSQVNHIQMATSNQAILFAHHSIFVICVYLHWMIDSFKLNSVDIRHLPQGQSLWRWNQMKMRSIWHYVLILQREKQNTWLIAKITDEWDTDRMCRQSYNTTCCILWV